MTGPTVFTVEIEMPDGRRIAVSIDVPDEHPANDDWSDLAEHAEVAQMAAAHALGIIHRGDQSRARREARRAAEAAEVPF